MNVKKEIQNFFSFQIEKLISETRITFDIYLYFEKSQHLLAWKLSGEVLTQEFIENAKAKKIEALWSPVEQKEIFESYINQNTKTIVKNDSESLQEAKEEKEPSLNIKESKTKEGAALREALQHPHIPKEEKKEMLSQYGHELIQEALSASNNQKLRKTKIKAKYIVQDLLLETSLDTLKVAQELWKISDSMPELTHSLNVSTYAVVFAMAFGRIETDVLGDIALAGLLHDIGTTQIPLQLSKKPWNSLSKDEKIQYFSHSQLSINLISEQLPDVNERVKKLIYQHHEQFNGEGYPLHIKGFEFDDLSQILALAELFESFSNSQWDGESRTMKESFELLNTLEAEKNFPQFFNPDILSVVLKWLESQIEKEALGQASTTIQKQTKAIMKTAA